MRVWIATVWIARDENGDLFMYDKKPERCEKFFAPATRTTITPLSWWALPKSSFIEVTWENSPIKYDLVMTFKVSETKEGGKR